MSKVIGPRELALRAQREAEAKPTKKTVGDLIVSSHAWSGTFGGSMPATSGKKPVKKKRKSKP
jgi:hypothetical protein